MKVNFRTYRGLAGDLQTLLIGEVPNDIECRLFTDGSLLSLRYAKRKILKAFELKTGKKHIEK